MRNPAKFLFALLMAACRGLLAAEPLLLLAMILAFWHHSPPIRDQWVWLLALVPPVYAARLVVHRRLWTPSPLDWLLLALLPLTALNFQAAPYARQDYVVLICRPLLGILIYFYCAEHVRTGGSLRHLSRRNDNTEAIPYKPLRTLLITTLITAFLMVFTGLTAQQWDNKSAALSPIIDLLPTLDHRAILPDMLLSFNVNELAGALAWLAPLTAGLALYPWRPAVRGLYGLAAALLLLALFLGQSRFGLTGVLAALGLLALLQMRGRVRLAGLAGVGALVLLQVMLMTGMSIPAKEGEQSGTGLTARDENTLEARLDTWRSGLMMVRDYPLTGVGMSMFRTAVGREPYIIPYYAGRTYTAPHAHNELIQIGTDLGLPGMLLFAGWHLAAGFMLLRGWHSGDVRIRAVAAAVAAGLLGHAVYGLGDAIALWDRFAFLFWWMLGLAGAQYQALQQLQAASQKQI